MKGEKRIMFDKEGFIVQFYKSPNGKMVELPITNIDEDDRDYFIRNDIVVSLEEIRGQYVVYGCPRSDESEESEIIVLSRGRTCEEVMRELRNLCERKFV